MSGKALVPLALVPTYQKMILPIAPSSGPSRPTRPTWVARVPTPEGLEAMKKCQEIVRRMRAASKAEREQQCGGRWQVAGLSGTWFLWHLVDLAEKKQYKFSEESVAAK